jgi:hypothetical protein
VSNTWIICPLDGNSLWKHRIMPNKMPGSQELGRKGATAPPRDESAAY